MTQRRPFIPFSSIAAGLFMVLVAIQGHAAPPLQPHEEIVKTKDGCGLIMDKSVEHASIQRDLFSKVTWGGACIEGLAMGQGILANGFEIAGQPKLLPLRGWAWYGRPFGASEVRWDNGRTGVVFTWSGKSVSYRNSDKPAWSAIHSESSNVADGTVSVTAMAVNGKATVSVFDESKTPKFSTHACPGGSSSGCEAVWTQHATPVIERVKRFIAENEPKANARRAEVQVLVAKWQKQIGAKEVARREAAAMQAASVASKHAKWELDCLQKESRITIDSIDFNRPQSEMDARKARALRNLYEGECKGHPNAAKALAEASKLMRESDASLAKEQAQAREIEQAHAKQREADARDRREAFAILGKAAEGYAAAAAGGGSGERRQAALDAMVKATDDTAPAGAGNAGASSRIMQPGQHGTVSRPPDPRCAFAKLDFGAKAAVARQIKSGDVLDLRILPIRNVSKDTLYANQEKTATESAKLARIETDSEERIARALAERGLREWKESLDCLEQHNELLAKGEAWPQMVAFPREWQHYTDVELWKLGQLNPSNERRYPWKDCTRGTLGLKYGLGQDGQLVFHRGAGVGGVYSRFLLESQLIYLRNIYAELTGNSELAATLRRFRQDPRTTPGGQHILAILKDQITGLECEAARGYPLSSENVFVVRIHSQRRPYSRFPGDAIPRCQPEKCLDF